MENEPNLIRVDKAIRAIFPGLGARHVDEAIHARLITDSELRPVKKGNRIASENPLVSSKLTAHLERIRVTSGINIPIIADETDWAVIDKPAGLPSHPVSLFDTRTVTHWATHRWPEILDHFPGVQPTITPHRLDTGTSGLLIVAKNRHGFDYWRELFRESKVGKMYLAQCWGNPAWDTHRIDNLLDHHPTDRRRMIVSPLGRKAETELAVISRSADQCLVSARMKTGVTHQIRIHLSQIELPLLGDALYDPAWESRILKPTFHQLRAIEISAPGHAYRLPSESIPF